MSVIRQNDLTAGILCEQSDIYIIHTDKAKQAYIRNIIWKLFDAY